MKTKLVITLSDGDYLCQECDQWTVEAGMLSAVSDGVLIAVFKEGWNQVQVVSDSHYKTVLEMLAERAVKRLGFR